MPPSLLLAMGLETHVTAEEGNEEKIVTSPPVCEKPLSGCHTEVYVLSLPTHCSHCASCSFLSFFLLTASHLCLSINVLMSPLSLFESVRLSSHHLHAAIPSWLKYIM